jgi:hypothetical protein
MSAPDHDHADDATTSGRSERAREDDERCLAVLLLLHDERAVEPELAAWARAHAAANPSCAAAFAEFVEQSAALAAAPVRRARPEFTERVLAKLFPVAGDRGADADILPFVRRLAVAAGLALALSLFAELARPSAVQADNALQRQRHAADHFRHGAFGPQDIETGLRERLKDPQFGEQSGASRPASPQPASSQPSGGGR